LKTSEGSVRIRWGCVWVPKVPNVGCGMSKLRMPMVWDTLNMSTCVQVATDLSIQYPTATAPAADCGRRVIYCRAAV